MLLRHILEKYCFTAWFYTSLWNVVNSSSVSVMPPESHRQMEVQVKVRANGTAMRSCRDVCTDCMSVPRKFIHQKETTLEFCQTATMFLQTYGESLWWVWTAASSGVSHVTSRSTVYDFLTFSVFCSILQTCFISNSLRGFPAWVEV